MFCRGCWTNIPDGTPTCPKCGADPKSEPSSAARPSPARVPVKPVVVKPQKKGLSSTLALVALVLVVSAVFVYHYSGRFAPPPAALTDNAPPPSAPVLNDLAVVAPAPIPLKLDEVEAVSVSGRVDEFNAAVEAYNSNDYEKAAGIFTTLVMEAKDDGEKARMKTNLARSLASMALVEYNNGGFEKSKTLYEEAIAHGVEPDFVKGLAATQVKLGDFDGAVKSLESIAADAYVSQALFDLHLRLGIKHKQDGRVDDAVVSFEKALAINPQNEQARGALAALKRETGAEAGFRTKEGGHFAVKYDAVENAVAGHVISILLEEAYMRVGGDLGFYPDDAITAVLYGAEEFRDVTRSPAWAGALYDGRIKIPAGGITEKTELLSKVLFHEYTHAVVHRLAGGRAPVWLNEGLAQYEEGKRSGAEAAVLSELAASKISLRAFEGSFMRFDAREAQAAYLISLSAVEYMMDEFGGSSAKRVLEGLKAGKTLDNAMRDSIYLSYDDFNDAWLKSLK